MRRRISEVARFTRQPDAVAAFYAALLEHPIPASGQGAYHFSVDGVTLLVHPVGDGPPAPGWPADVDHIALEVDDLEAECERLRTAGYAVLGPARFPWGRSAYLYDPDGRMVELHAPIEPPSKPADA
ncbi:MAG: VOC family protein [Armatimonadota bacterium]|nr:VOC family protein [Armatimonadota bacterium]MDR7448302.1 VOC family protein [Armatimonadota bacterium]MDR7458331.1 VOC family protein [Armatimonadota bacterium]MDR7478366.1 VOC family protein [Armatimonadota bacterium]MDR7487300.1 VOC family protein [Armatimonadota bacterium]